MEHATVEESGPVDWDKLDAIVKERDIARAERDKLESERGSWMRGLKCAVCGGTGEDNEARTCRTCGGEGGVWMTWKQRAELLEAALRGIEFAADRLANHTGDDRRFAFLRERIKRETASLGLKETA
jgi:RecJ-like exonuclease